MKILADICGLYKVETRLMLAIISVESSFKQYAIRYEPEYRFLYKTAQFSKQNSITEQTEIQLQKFSWGYVQCMGGVAREFLFDGPMPHLFEPEHNFRVGCAKLKDLYYKSQNWWRAVLLYNGGGDHGYVDRVKTAYDNFKQ